MSNWRPGVVVDNEQRGEVWLAPPRDIQPLPVEPDPGVPMREAGRILGLLANSRPGLAVALAEDFRDLVTAVMRGEAPPKARVSFDGKRGER